MKVLNGSQRPMNEVLQIVDFVAERSRYADMASLHLHHRGHEFPYGVATKNQTDRRVGTPSRIDVWLPYVVYPRADVYDAAQVGTISLHDWREHFVLILAHELRHIEQFWMSRSQPENIETDAEMTGIRILNQWRAAQGRSPVRPKRSGLLRSTTSGKTSLRAAARQARTPR